MSGMFIGAQNAALNFEMDAAAVPEPGAWALLLLGFGSMGHAIRRRRCVQLMALSAAGP